MPSKRRLIDSSFGRGGLAESPLRMAGRRRRGRRAAALLQIIKHESYELLYE
jgi:hypothetical protein